MKRGLLRSWLRIFQRRREEEERATELEDYLARETEDNLARGMAPEKAQRLAHVKLGSMRRIREEIYEMNGIGFLETLWQDLRYGMRMLRKSPGFTAVAVLTLALGIGANTAIFSLVNGIVLNPLPYPASNQVVAVYTRDPSFGQGGMSLPAFLDWQRENRSFSSLATYSCTDLTMIGTGEPERVPVAQVSSEFFDVFDVKPLLGSTLRAEDDHLGAAPVVLLSEGFWRRRFGGAPSVLGKAINFSGTAYTVIGIIPGSFHFAGENFQPSDAYIPIGEWQDPAMRDRHIQRNRAVGRLRLGVTLSQAQSDMDGVARRIAEQFPDTEKGVGIALVPLKQDITKGVAPTLYILLSAVFFVLLIACANIANLLLARSTTRTREFALRVAMGATRVRVIRQVLTESVLLALGGGILGLLVAALGTATVINVLPAALPRSGEISVDTRVLLFTFGSSLLAGILFGLYPAIKASQGGLQDALKEGGRGASGLRHRLHRALAVAEIALALVLLTGAGLAMRSLAKAWQVDPGFNPHNVLSFGLAFPPSMSNASPDALREYFRQVTSNLEQIPGVEAASTLTASRPMRLNAYDAFWVEGQPKPLNEADMKWVVVYAVQPDYLKTMQIPLEQGRFISASDDAHSRTVFVIDDTFARKYFGNENPVGKRVNLSLVGMQGVIVGVVGHVKQFGLDGDVPSRHQAQIYGSVLQFPDRLMRLGVSLARFVLRSRGNPADMVGPVRHAVEAMNSEQVIFNVETMDQTVYSSLAARRFSMILLGVFAGLALVLACVGVYGVVSYLVGQQIHEIGVRMALGARPVDILRLIVGHGAAMSFLGVAIGLAAALGLTGLMANMLFGVSAHDPLTLGAVGLVLLVVGLAACYIPARRAMRVDPMVALRYE